MVDLFHAYAGKAVFLCMKKGELAKVMAEQRNLIGFNYNDGLTKIDAKVFSKGSTMAPNTIEQFSLMLKHAARCEASDLRFLMADAWAIQSVAGTPAKKGSAWISLRSVFYINARRLNWTLILSSPYRCPTLRRHFS